MKGVEYVLKLKIHKLAAAVIAACCAITLASCGSKGGSSKANASVTQQTTVTTTTSITTATTPAVTQPEETQTTTPEEKPVPQGKYNNLTGEYTLSDAAVGKRPIAVMVNNITFSLPQYGIAAADMLIECPVEGTITRLMAVYGDMTKIPNVCSVRSCRYYFPILAQSFDAVYMHWGKDETVAKDTLESLNIDRLDGYNNSFVFGRDEERMKTFAYEHTGYYKGPLTEQALDQSGIRKTLKEDKNKPVFPFREEAQAVSDTKCTKCKAVFSADYFSDFAYNADEDVYYKSHNGAPHIDSSTGQQLAFENVFILGTTTRIINQNNLLISLDWHGGDGYYISHGSITPVKWSKADEFADIVITDQNGSVIEVNPGKSYLGFTPRLSDTIYS